MLNAVLFRSDSIIGTNVNPESSQPHLPLVDGVALSPRPQFKQSLDRSVLSSDNDMVPKAKLTSVL